MLPPPQPASRIKPPTTRKTAKKVPFLVRELLQLRLIPINTNPATASQPKENRLEPPRVAGGTLSEAAAAPAVTVRVALALPVGSKVTEFEPSEHVGEPA